jgi:lysophospholipase L1-like esterase
MIRQRLRRWFRRRPVRYRQRLLAFSERTREHERWFKRLIIAATCLVVVGMLWVSPWGRYGAATAASEARQVVRQALGLPKPRAEVDAEWRRFRELGIQESSRALGRVYAEADPAMQGLMRYAGLDPEQGLLRWGNYNLTLLLPSKVFEADDEGRSYRLRPSTRSIWVRNITLKSGVLMFFLVPDRPELAEVLRGTSGIPVETSRQSTNSWGLRGPEPEPDTPLRVMVLGDSYMQGMFVGDEATPPESLRRYLEGRVGKRVSVLNAGVLGYSPEQYYHSLTAFAGRFPPHFVVVSIYCNDFGDLHEVATKGRGDWEEGRYWLEQIAAFCRAREWPHLIVPVPYTPGMLGRRHAGSYPGMISNALEINSLTFLDPTETFIDAHLEMVIDGHRRRRRPQGCPLFNDDIGDGHFSPDGSRVWAERVGRRILLLLEEDRARRLAAGLTPRTPEVLPPGPSSHEAPKG